MLSTFDTFISFLFLTLILCFYSFENLESLVKHVDELTQQIESRKVVIEKGIKILIFPKITCLFPRRYGDS